MKKGDRVCIYMPMVAELPMAMLACARIGAIHSVRDLTQAFVILLIEFNAD